VPDPTKHGWGRRLPTAVGRYYHKEELTANLNGAVVQGLSKWGGRDDQQMQIMSGTVVSGQLGTCSLSLIEGCVSVALRVLPFEINA